MLQRPVVRKPRATFELLVHVPDSCFRYCSENILVHIPVHQLPRKIIMAASFVEFLRAGGVNQRLRKELEPSELETEREFECEPGT